MRDDPAPIPEVLEAASAPDERKHLGRRVRGMAWFAGAHLFGTCSAGSRRP